MSSFYKKSLADIHDSTFSYFAQGTSNGLLEIFEKNKIIKGHIVDLGCGSGILAKTMISSGFTVTGIDQSPWMVSIAREKVPNGTFKLSSFYDVEIPTCNVVTSTGECF